MFLEYLLGVIFGVLLTTTYVVWRSTFGRMEIDQNDNIRIVLNKEPKTKWFIMRIARVVRADSMDYNE